MASIHDSLAADFVTPNLQSHFGHSATYHIKVGGGEHPITFRHAGQQRTDITDQRLHRVQNRGLTIVIQKSDIENHRPVQGDYLEYDSLNFDFQAIESETTNSYVVQFAAGHMNNSGKRGPGL